MSIYLYNVGFSVADAPTGSFTSTGWYKYNGSTQLPVTTGLSVIPSVLPISNWVSVSPTSFNSAQMPNPDYVILRVFNSDNSPSSYRVKVVTIFGQGDSATPPPTNSTVQSPFWNGTNPLPLIDCDEAAIQQPSVPNWPTPVTDAQSGSNASWSYCLGEVQGSSCDYVFNVGAGIYVISTGAKYAFGMDPRMKVTGTNMDGVSGKDQAA